MKIKLYFLFFFFPFLTCASEIIVPLATSQSLIPIHSEKLSSSDGTFPTSYLQSLEEVLKFDLNFFGTTCNEGNLETSRIFLLKPELKKNTLSLSLLSPKNGQSFSLNNLVLSGQLCSDRRIIHQVADFVYHAITGKKGIASTRILYALQTQKEGVNESMSWESAIWESDYDGANAIKLTDEKNYCITPLFYPKVNNLGSRKFLYVSYKLGQPKIFSTSIGQLHGDQIISLRGNQLLPAFSPKGDMIAFISDASGSADLFIQPFHPETGPYGKPIQLYSFNSSVQASPTFRPDGKKIAFVSDKDGTPRIYLIDLPSPTQKSTSKLFCLTKKNRENTCPSWSPDGTKLAYSARIDGIRQIMIYDFLSKEEFQLTTGLEHKENPCWSPNSLHIIFNSVGHSSSELFIINIDKKEIIQITSGGGKKHYPAWEPYIK